MEQAVGLAAELLHILLPFRTMSAAALHTASAVVSGRLVMVPLLSRRQLKTTNPLHRLQRPCQSLALQATREASRKHAVSRRCREERRRWASPERCFAPPPSCSPMATGVAFVLTALPAASGEQHAWDPTKADARHWRSIPPV